MSYVSCMSLVDWIYYQLYPPEARKDIIEECYEERTPIYQLKDDIRLRFPVYASNLPSMVRVYETQNQTSGSVVHSYKYVLDLVIKWINLHSEPNYVLRSVMEFDAHMGIWLAWQSMLYTEKLVGGNFAEFSPIYDYKTIENWLGQPRALREDFRTSPALLSPKASDIDIKGLLTMMDPTDTYKGKQWNGIGCLALLSDPESRVGENIKINLQHVIRIGQEMELYPIGVRVGEEEE